MGLPDTHWGLKILSLFLGHKRIITISADCIPTDILTRFVITKVESDDKDIRIYLDQKADLEYLEDINIESKGFIGSRLSDKRQRYRFDSTLKTLV